jgi:hypothetical protein
MRVSDRVRLLARRETMHDLLQAFEVEGDDVVRAKARLHEVSAQE